MTPMTLVRRHARTALTTVALVLAGTGVLTTSAAPISSGTRPVYVPITPCRLLDTRPGADNVGARVGALAAGETFTTAGRGKVGKCDLPTDAVALGLNVAIIAPTADSYLTVFPADATSRPLAANLNWVAGQAPTPNAVTAKLGADGKLAFFNLAGSVHLAVDVQGYYQDANYDDRYYTRTEADTTFATSAALAGLATATAGEISDLQSRAPLEAIGQANPDLATPADTDRADVYTVTSTHRGRWSLTSTVTVSSADCGTFLPRYLYLTIDGTPVKETTAVLAGDVSTTTEITLAGISSFAVNAGPHQVGYELGCLSGTASLGLFGIPGVNVVVYPAAS